MSIPTEIIGKTLIKNIEALLSLYRILVKISTQMEKSKRQRTDYQSRHDCGPSHLAKVRATKTRYGSPVLIFIIIQTATPVNIILIVSFLFLCKETKKKKL